MGLRAACADDLRGLVLYGSYARGEEHEESDIDVIVLFKDEESAAAYTSRVNDLAYRIFEDRYALLAPMSMSERKYQVGRSPFFINVKREGMFIFTEEAAELSEEIQKLMAEAERSLGAARGILEDGYFDYAVSRAYYAMFYAASAALLTKGLTFSRHSGVVSGFGRHLTGEGLLPRQLHLDFDRAQKLRHLGDYSTEPFERETAEEALENARRFVDAVRGYLDEVV